MTPQALTALKESIAHWERVASGTMFNTESVGANNCALCREFNWFDLPAGKSYDDRCVGCPVCDKTGKRFCKGTPYDVFQTKQETLVLSSSFKSWLATPEARDLAAKELAFLKSLLPEYEK